MLNRNFRVLALAMCLSLVSFAAEAAVLRGKVVDKTNNEPLIGAAVMVPNTTIGTATGLDGDFELNIAEGTTTLSVMYMSYVTAEVAIDTQNLPAQLIIALEPDAQVLDVVAVETKANLETEANLQNERIASNVAIENIGSREMALKGLSNVQEGVKKLTSVSVASSGQLVVRGLGDRYSITTLNGQPIASPNPDNKLIPLDIFPSSTVKNITVSKVYDAKSYADYSGAHVDIATKDLAGDNFFNIGFSGGGQFNTVGQDFYRMDNVSMFTSSKADAAAYDLDQDINDYTLQKGALPFATGFDVEKSTALPVFGGNIAWGHSYDIADQRLSLMASAGISNDQKKDLGAINKIYEAGGEITDSYVSDNYETTLKMASLASATMTLRESDYINYTLFYARNAEEKYTLRDGYDQDDNQLLGSNSVTHIYELMTNQLHGEHKLGEKVKLNWLGSYTTTSSDEPDRRQVMFQKRENNDLILFDLNQQETMRYFGELGEDELNGNIYFDYNFLDEHTITLGAAYKSKKRDYIGRNFYYNIRPFSGVVGEAGSVFENPYSVDESLSIGNMEAGAFDLVRRFQLKDRYNSSSDVISGYLSTDLSFEEKWLINAGVRYELSNQTVNYYTSYADSRVYEKPDFFPALNVKYNMNEKNQLRVAFSRTVTRPSFIEMAPFLYKEMFGSAQVQGNSALNNGYNFNYDLRYEVFLPKGDMFSVTAYYKYLDAPIERVQDISGGGEIHTFYNAEAGLAAGAEVEFKKTLAEALVLSLNGSYMYTNVSLSDGGSYTNKDRALQGASPYLVNADLTYSPRFGEDKMLSLALLYNLQGERIHTVGTAQRGDIMQEDVHTLNFAAKYQLNSVVEISASLTNLLNRPEEYFQEINGERKLVERHFYGMGGEIGLSLKF